MTTETMKPYPAYKDSGIEWIGEIPEGWDVVKINNVSKKITNGYVGPTRDILKEQGIRYLQSLHIKNNQIKFIPPYYVSEEWSNIHSRSILQKDDVLVVQTGDIGQVTIVKDDFVGCNCHALIIISPKNNMLGEFISIFLNSNYGFHTLKSIQTGALHPHLNSTKVKDVNILVPPISEQKSIATFLDNQTAKIDTLIENKQKQIELLKEERTAIINQAVTKGLNPDVSMRDSGIEWLGEIPEHWGITKLKFILNKIGSGLTPRGGAEVYQDYGVPLLRSQNVHFDGLRLDDVAYISNKTHKSMNRSAVKPNDVLINITGASIGRCAIIPNDFSDGNVNQHVCILRTSEKILSKFLHLLLSSQIGQLQVFNSQNGAAREGLNFEQLGDFFVTLPLLDEQNELTKSISAYIDESMVLISKIQNQITLLQEYRTALISEAVTGKIDLRNQHEFPTPQ